MSMHNNDELLKKSSEELYIKFKGIIKKIHERYDFLNLDEIEFKSLVIPILDKCLKEYKQNNFFSFHTYCFGELDEYFEQYSFDMMNTIEEKSDNNTYNIYSHEESSSVDDESDNSYLPNVFQQYCKNIKSTMTFEEEQELALKVKAGDQDAKEEFIERNLRLVISIAKKYNNTDLSFMDSKKI